MAKLLSHRKPVLVAAQDLFTPKEACINDGSGILFGFVYQKDIADSVLKRP